MRVNVSYVQRCKAAAHVFQVLLTFIASCLTLAVLTKQGDTGGATKFFFATCFLTIPAIIYLVMVPMFSRAERFANVNAFLAVDALMTLLWFCSFISVAVWNANGIKQGAEEQKKPRNCDAFKYGPASKCKLSRVAVGFGAFIFIFFFLTTAISFYYLRSYRKNGVLPYESNKVSPHHASGETTKADNAWSTEIEPHRDSHDSEDDRRTEHGGGQHDDEYALLHSTDTDEGRHPGRPLSWGEERRHTGYAAYGEGGSALSPGGYEEYRREAGGQQTGYPAQGGYPAPGQGQGYSFSGGHER